MAAVAAPEDTMDQKVREEVYRFFLRLAAIADASHDFKGDRAGGGGSIFDKIFKAYKEIGAPAGTTPREDEILSESEVMNLILKYLKKEGKKTEATLFKEKFLTGTPESPERVIGTYSRWREDPHPVTVTSLLIAKKEGGSYRWTRSAQQLHDFMNPTGSGEVAFTIDAADVPFYDLFMEEELVGAGGEPKKLYYLETREGISDAASKVVLRPPKPKADGSPRRMAVEIITKKDDAQSTAMYGAFSAAAAAGSEPLSSFFSDYNVSLSPVALSAAGIPSTTLSFVGPGVDQKIQLLRTNTEDSHPNSVPTLAGRIKGFLSRLFGGARAVAPGPEERMKYHVSLQQKRSGDWLQVLSCLQPERFGLKPTTRVILVTLDKVCLAYAIFMGIDVIMTYKDEKKNKWLVRFNRATGPPVSELELFTKSARALPAAEIPIGGDRHVDYERFKRMYVQILNEIEGGYETALESKIKGAAAAGGVDGPTKEILNAAMNLAVFRTLCPGMMGGAAADEVATLAAYRDDGGGAGAAAGAGAGAAASGSARRREGLVAAREAYKIYRQNYLVLEAAGRQVRGATAEELIAGLKAYMKSMQVLKGRGAAAAPATETYELVSRLKISDGFLFRKGNAGVNGAGIFTYLKTGLKEGTLRAILRALDGIEGGIADAERRGRFTDFVKTAQLALGLEEAAEELPTPSVANVPSEVLVGTMEEAARGETSAIPFGVVFPDGGVFVGGARTKAMARKAFGRGLSKAPRPPVVASAAAPASVSSVKVSASDTEMAANYFTDGIRISDYGVALSILAARFKNDLRRGGGGALHGGQRSRGKGPKKGISASAQRKRRENKAIAIRKDLRETRIAERRRASGAPAKFQHNPLATLYIFMKEISFRLTFETDGEVIDAYKAILMEIKRVLISINPDRIPIDIIIRLYTYELELLQGKHGAHNLCQDILASYYGIRSTTALEAQEGVFADLMRLGPVSLLYTLFPVADIVALAKYLQVVQGGFYSDTPMRKRSASSSATRRSPRASASPSRSRSRKSAAANAAMGNVPSSGSMSI
jgi:hypothetical protein